jgi:hypothetical protein
MTMNTRAGENFKSGAGAASLWCGLLLGPLAALSQLEGNYALVLRSCSAGRKWPLHLVSLTAIAITVFAWTLSYRHWRRLGGTWEDDGAGAVPRARFMAAIGILISVIMLLVIIAQWIPVFIYGPCHR